MYILSNLNQTLCIKHYIQLDHFPSKINKSNTIYLSRNRFVFIFDLSYISSLEFSLTIVRKHIEIVWPTQHYNLLRVINDSDYTINEHSKRSLTILKLITLYFKPCINCVRKLYSEAVFTAIKLPYEHLIEWLYLSPTFEYVCIHIRCTTLNCWTYESTFHLSLAAGVVVVVVAVRVVGTGASKLGSSHLCTHANANNPIFSLSIYLWIKRGHHTRARFCICLELRNAVGIGTVQIN